MMHSRAEFHQRADEVRFAKSAQTMGALRSSNSRIRAVLAFPPTHRCSK
jgi:hypothetical protein